MEQLGFWQFTAVFAIFVWSGFVRNALGFGGAVLSLPLFLFVVDNPVEILPIIGIHLMVAVAINLRKHYTHIDWAYLKKTLIIIIPFKVLGVIGLLSLPADVLNASVYVLTLCYAISYITQVNVRVNSRALDWALLAGGGYMSGTSLIGAPLIIAVYSKYIAPNALRATLFVLWFILVAIKLIGFVLTDTPLNIKWALYTWPFALAGQFLGDIVHEKILTLDKTVFMRSIGLGLLIICLLGMSISHHDTL